ncbi:hypothetical protein ACODT5_06570 [Streptomyces sp. 5.8]
MRKLIVPTLRTCPASRTSEEEKFDVLRDAEPQNDRQLLGCIDV